MYAERILDKIVRMRAARTQAKSDARCPLYLIFSLPLPRACFPVFTSKTQHLVHNRAPKKPTGGGKAKVKRGGDQDRSETDRGARRRSLFGIFKRARRFLTHMLSGSARLDQSATYPETGTHTQQRQRTNRDRVSENFLKRASIFAVPQTALTKRAGPLHLQ